jgi:hypothetical protein
MTEDEVTMRLTVALNHLHAFASTFNPEDVVDEESKLSAIDLNVILQALERVNWTSNPAPDA